VFATLGIQQAMRMRHIFICSLHSSTVFFHITSKWCDFQKKNAIKQKKVCCDFLYNFV
jgi:hypothetical protein